MIEKKSNPTIISILIPTRDNESDLIDCLSSIQKLDYNLKDIEVIIWDNNSNKDCKKRVKEFFETELKDYPFRLEFFENDSNYGVYTSRDELLRMVTPEAKYVLSIDDDVILPSNLLKDVLPLFSKDKSIGIIGPRIVYDDDPSETAHGAGFVNNCLGRYTTKDVQIVVECDYVIGCCMLIRKQLIDEIGSFDRNYYISHGEVDFCLRAKKKGYRVVYDPSVVVRHRVDKGGTRSLERMYYVYRNKLLVIKKNWPIPQKWIALFIYSFLAFPKAVINSILVNKKIDCREIKIIIIAMRDGWLNRFGKRV